MEPHIPTIEQMDTNNVSFGWKRFMQHSEWKSMEDAQKWLDRSRLEGRNGFTYRVVLYRNPLRR